LSWENGTPPFGLNDAKIATYTATDNYGSAVDVFSVQALNVTMRMTQAELTGDDQITAVASRPIAAQIEMRFGGVSIAALEVMLGITATSSIASPSNIKDLKVNGGIDLPYFGLVGKSLAAEGAGQLEIYIPKCRIMSDIQLVQLEYGVFSINSVTLTAIPDATYGLLSVIEAEAERVLAIPPSDIPTL